MIGRWADVGSLTVSNDVSEHIATLTAENARLKAELHDYRRLRRQIGSPAVGDYRIIAGEIVARPIESLRSEFVINRGARDGVVVNAPVVVQGSVLAGFIRELHDETAIVQLLVHPQARVAAEAVGEIPARALVQGKSYTSIFLMNVPRDVELQRGQEVVSVSESTQLPYGLVIGTIDSIENDEHDPYQHARLSLPYDPDELVAVTILAPP